MAIFKTIAHQAKNYPEILPVLGVTALAVVMGTYMIVRNYDFNRVQWTTGDPALKIKPDTNMKLWNNHPQTGGEFIKKNEATKN